MREDALVPLGDDLRAYPLGESDYGTRRDPQRDEWVPPESKDEALSVNIAQTMDWDLFRKILGWTREDDTAPLLNMKDASPHALTPVEKERCENMQITVTSVITYGSHATEPSAKSEDQYRMHKTYNLKGNTTL